MLLALKLLHMDVLEGNPETRDPEGEVRHEGQIRDSDTASKRSRPVSPSALMSVSNTVVNGEGSKRYQPTSISAVPPSIESAGVVGAVNAGVATHPWQEQMEKGQERVEILVRSLCDSINTMRMEMGSVKHDLSDLKRRMAEQHSSDRPGDFELYASHIAFSSPGRLRPAEVSTSPQHDNVSASVVFPTSASNGGVRATSFRKSMLSTGAQLGDDRPY